MSPRRLQVRELLVRLDRTSSVPVGRQLEEQLRSAIREGRLPYGEQLPSTRVLAEDLSVSRGVVVRAYGQLAAEGYLALRQGANTSVKAARIGSLARSTRPRVPERRFRHDLRPERPDLSLFPRSQWLRSLRHALTTAADSEIGYIDRRGVESLREEIARYLARARGVTAAPDLMLVTAGSTHALTLIGRVLRRQGETAIAFENPSHRLLTSHARRAGLEPVGIPVDQDGLAVERLAASGVRAVVVSPAHQFPTGVAYSAERRLALVAWAQERGGLIVEDDYDAEFRYDRPPVGALQGLAPDHVAYIGSTSKTLAPGLRLGWAALPARLVEPVAEELWDATLHLPAIDQLALADFVRRGEFDRHVRRVRSVYRRRRNALVRTLRFALPHLPISGIAAGLHLILELESSENEAAAAARAAELGVAVDCVTRHALPGYDGAVGLLVGYGAIPEPAIPSAVQELARALTTRSEGLALGAKATRLDDEEPLARTG